MSHKYEWYTQLQKCVILLLCKSSADSDDVNTILLKIPKQIFPVTYRGVKNLFAALITCLIYFHVSMAVQYSLEIKVYDWLLGVIEKVSSFYWLSFISGYFIRRTQTYKETFVCHVRTSTYKNNNNSRYYHPKNTILVG